MRFRPSTRSWLLSDHALSTANGESRAIYLAANPLSVLGDDRIDSRSSYSKRFRVLYFRADDDVEVDNGHGSDALLPVFGALKYGWGLDKNRWLGRIRKVRFECAYWYLRRGQECKRHLYPRVALFAGLEEVCIKCEWVRPSSITRLRRERW